VNVSLDEASMISLGRGREDLVALDNALNALATLDPRRSQVVELRVFYFKNVRVEPNSDYSVH